MPVPSPAPKATQEIQEVPLKIVGGNLFGRYSKISEEQTFNFIVSDGALVPYAGYKNVLTQSETSKGRGIYASSRLEIMVAVWGSQAYAIKQGTTGILSASFIGNLQTSSGDVFIAENNNGEIAITDGSKIYVYKPSTSSFKTSGTVISATEFIVPSTLTNPGYISFQNGRLLVANNGTTNWYLSAINDATVWPAAANSIGALQSKPDTVQAAVPSPGGGNNLYLFGHNVVEQWQDVGNALFPYQRSSTFNVDFGTVNASSIAALEDYVVWLSANEQSGVTLMVIEGNRSQSISTDGIDFKLSTIKFPEDCTGFLFRQDGHVIYQFTFTKDNISYAYDFTSRMFFTVTDEKLNYHIARNVVFFNNHYYFVSLNGGNLYDFGTEFTDFIYAPDEIKVIPRIRVCPPVRLPSQRMFIIKSVGFTIENGQPNRIVNVTSTETVGKDIDTENSQDITTQDTVLITTEGGDSSTTTVTSTQSSAVVDLSLSRDGGESFGNSWRMPMNATGRRKSRLIWQRCGQANDLTVQVRFSGFGRFVAFDGVIEVYQ